MYRHFIIAFEAASNQLWLSNIMKQLNFDDGDTALDTDIQMMLVMAENNNNFS